MNKKTANYMSALSMMMPHMPIESKIKQKLEGIDIKSEGELIKQKKSKLSANMRRLVMTEYEKLYDIKNEN